MEHIDYTFESIDALEYLKELYPSNLNPDIASLLFCQDDDEVWLEIIYIEKTAFGLKSKKEILNLEYIAADEDYSLFPDMPLYNTMNSIEENAGNFFHDAGTLYETTDILINDDDIPEQKDEEEKTDLSENEELKKIIFALKTIFDYFKNHVPIDDKDNVSCFQNYVLNSLNSFIAGEGLYEFSFSLDLENDENHRCWISFATDGNCLTVLKEGHVFTPGIGGDTYTDWMFTIWDNGETDGELELSQEEISEMIQNNAWIDVESPDNFMGYFEQAEFS